MGHYRDLDVLDAADLVADDINRLVNAIPRLLHVRQMTESAQSIGANISEGFGRGSRGERNQFLRVARGSSEETIRHLSANFRNQRIPEKNYWNLRNRLATISKMLTSVSET
jgi:four helix bundle protein